VLNVTLLLFFYFYPIYFLIFHTIFYCSYSLFTFYMTLFIHILNYLSIFLFHRTISYFIIHPCFYCHLSKIITQKLCFSKYLSDMVTANYRFMFLLIGKERKLIKIFIVRKYRFFQQVHLVPF